MSEGIPKAPEMGKVLIVFAFIAGIVIGSAFFYYGVFPYLNQTNQTQSSSLGDQVALLNQQVNSLTLQLERFKNPEKFKACDQNVVFEGSCKKLCSGVQFDGSTKTCSEKTAGCCTVTAPFDSVDVCNTACSVKSNPPTTAPMVLFAQTDRENYARAGTVSLVLFNPSEKPLYFTNNLSIERKQNNEWAQFGSLGEAPCGVPSAPTHPVELNPSTLQLLSWNAQHIDCSEYPAGVQKTIQATGGTFRFKISYGSYKIFYGAEASLTPIAYSNEFTIQ